MDLAARIVRLSDVYSNYRNNLEVLGPIVDRLKLGQKRQDGGLREAFFATLELLSALYEMDHSPKWNELKARLYVSFVKKSPTTNTSVSSGLASRVLRPGQSIGVLNCGTGPIKFQFYKMDQERVTRVLIDFTPPAEQELYIASVVHPDKLAALREGIASTLNYLRMKQRQVPVVALVTGELRERWAKEQEHEQEAKQKKDSTTTTLETAIRSLFQGLEVLPWATLLPEIHKTEGAPLASYFLPQHVEGMFEDLACGNLIRDLAPQHDVLISCGIGRGTCQWSTKLGTIGHGFGMNHPEKLLVGGLVGGLVGRGGGDDHVGISLTGTIIGAFTPEYIAQLESMAASMDLPVIALKSGCLLLPERSNDLMTLLTRSTPTPNPSFAGFAKGQSLRCNVRGTFRFVELEGDMASSGKCVVKCGGDSVVLQLDSFFAAAAPLFDRPVPQISNAPVKELRLEHARRQLPLGYFALVKDKQRPPKIKDELSTPVLFENKEVGMAFCLPVKKSSCGVKDRTNLASL